MRVGLTLSTQAESRGARCSLSRRRRSTSPKLPMGRRRTKIIRKRPRRRRGRSPAAARRAARIAAFRGRMSTVADRRARSSGIYSASRFVQASTAVRGCGAAGSRRRQRRRAGRMSSPTTPSPAGRCAVHSAAPASSSVGDEERRPQRVEMVGGGGGGIGTRSDEERPRDLCRRGGAPRRRGWRTAPVAGRTAQDRQRHVGERVRVHLLVCAGAALISPCAIDEARLARVLHRRTRLRRRALGARGADVAAADGRRKSPSERPIGMLARSVRTNNGCRWTTSSCAYALACAPRARDHERPRRGPTQPNSRATRAPSAAW